MIIFIIILVLVIFILLWIISQKNDRISSMSSDAAKRKAIVSRNICSLTQQLVKSSLGNQNNTFDCSDSIPFNWYSDFDNSDCPLMLPPGVEVSIDGKPSLGHSSPDNLYGKYTVYTCDSGKCYHQSKYCGYLSSYKHTHCIFDVVRYKRPCTKCSVSTPEYMPKWYLNFVRASRELDVDWSANEVKK